MLSLFYFLVLCRSVATLRMKKETRRSRDEPPFYSFNEHTRLSASRLNRVSSATTKRKHSFSVSF